MADTKPLLKGFGALADVASQIATDKAVNSRRQRPNTYATSNLLSNPSIVQITFDNATTGSASVGSAQYAAIVSSVFASFVPYNFQWEIVESRLTVTLNAANTGTLTFLVF